MGSLGTWLAEEFRKHAEECDDDIPAFEVEAHTLETWTKTVDDLINELKRKPEQWSQHSIPLD